MCIVVSGLATRYNEPVTLSCMPARRIGDIKKESRVAELRRQQAGRTSRSDPWLKFGRVGISGAYYCGNTIYFNKVIVYNHACHLLCVRKCCVKEYLPVRNIFVLFVLEYIK